jgi:RNA polymerase sigma factor (sigma-70 family)
MTSELQSTTQRSWTRFLGTYEPLRSDLYRYCRHLTRSPWDAEDLAQDALARAFVTLAQMSDEPPSPRAWLFRVASNLWIDQMRRRREVATATPVPGLTSLLLDSAVVEVVGATTQYGPEAARRTVLYGMLFGSRLLADPHSNIGIDLSYREGALPELPRVEARFHRGAGSWSIGTSTRTAKPFAHSQPSSSTAIGSLSFETTSTMLISLPSSPASSACPCESTATAGGVTMHVRRENEDRHERFNLLENRIAGSASQHGGVRRTR